MIEIYLLEQLQAFAECGTLLAASQRLHLSQPALSHSMQKLEEQMGVKLFERRKNRISLNEAGNLAAEYAAGILEKEKEMMEQVRLLDRSSHTVTLGVCAPVPMGELGPLVSRIYGNMNVVSEIRNSDEELLDGLNGNRYQLIVTHQKPEGDMLYCQAYGKEKLFLALPAEHPLAVHSEVYLHDLDGQNLLLYTKIGFWYELCRQKMPNAHFLLMNEYDAFGEVAGIGAFPSFTSDVILKTNENYAKGKKIIPILDEEADATYYCVCRKTEQKRFAPLFHILKTNGAKEQKREG